MTAEERRHLEAGEAGLQVLDDNHALWTGQTPWETGHTSLVEIIEHIYITDGIGVTDNTGAARSKKTIRLENGEKANIICGPLKTFLLSIDQEVQEITVHFSVSQLTYGSEKTLLARWKKIIDVATLPTNAAFFTGGYGITALMVASLNTGRTEFMTEAPTPKAKRAATKAAKKDLKVEFKDMAVIIKDLVNLSQGKKGTQKTFVETLENSFGIDGSGNRLENAVFTFRDTATNVLIDKVKVTFTKGDSSFIKYSTKRGLITVKGKDQCNWTMLIEAPTYVSQTKTNIPFDPEKPILKLEIKLVKS